MTSHPITNNELLAGFTHPVQHAQSCFRSILQAMSTPGCLIDLTVELSPPPAISSAAAAILLTLADSTTRIYLPPFSAELCHWAAFHCGAPQVDMKQADYLFTSQRPPLASLASGSDEMPERGATLVLDMAIFGQGRHYRLTGPGIAKDQHLHVPFDESFAAEWQINHQNFPRGLDMILCSGQQIIALPRSVCIEEII